MVGDGRAGRSSTSSSSSHRFWSWSPWPVYSSLSAVPTRRGIWTTTCARSKRTLWVRRAFLLPDFRKPLDEANLSLLGALPSDVSRRLSANTELRVFALATDPRVPRFPLDRVCKPYDNADLQIRTAKD